MQKKAQMDAERKRLEEIKLKELEREKARREKLEEGEQKRRWRYWARREKMPATPVTTGGVTIGFRLGDGRRVVHKFRQDASLEELYLFVELESAPGSDEDGTVALPRPRADYHHTYSFRLSTAMPRRTLPLPDSSLTGTEQISIAQFGGLDGANVNVEGSVTEPSSDEDEEEDDD